jgi:hypothetical protein
MHLAAPAALVGVFITPHVVVALFPPAAAALAAVGAEPVVLGGFPPTAHQVALAEQAAKQPAVLVHTSPGKAREFVTEVLANYDNNRTIHRSYWANCGSSTIRNNTTKLSCIY